MMLAAVYHGPRDIRVEKVPIPELAPGELLLEVHAAGVCGTDASEYAHGPTMFPILDQHPVTGHRGPMIPGHEFGGRVVQIGSEVTGFSEGDLVTSGAGISCGACGQCEAGRTNLCERYATVGLQRSGGLAQYCVVPAAVCLNVSELGLTDDGAALVQPMSIAVHSMRRGRVGPDDEALVIGVGGVGAFLVYALAETGVTVTAVDLDRERLMIASALGAEATIRASGDRSLRESLNDNAPRLIYEVSGAPSALADAVQLVRPGGTVVVVGLQEQPFDLDARNLALSEIELVGTNAHTFGTDIPEAARLISSRGVKWKDVAPVALPLEEVVDGALIPLLEGRSSRIKNLVDPWSDERRPTFS